MDLYKANVIKADEIIDSGKPVSLFRSFESADANAGLSPVSEQTQRDNHKAEMEQHLSRVRDECYRKGFTEGVEFQKKELLPLLESVSTMVRTIPLIRKDIVAKTEEQIVKLSLAIAEKILNQEVATRKEVILEVLKGVLKNISETEGMKIRINPLDFRYIMEVKKDFLQAVDGVHNVVFEEDVSVKRGGAVVETMFGEVDARLESQLKEIRSAMLKL
jgi:flagellar assembly protein FliH